MPSSLQYAQSSSGLFLPSSHGSNRLIFTTSGAFSFTLPEGISAAKVAIFGGGGGGALKLFPGANAQPVGGGAGGGFSQKIIAGVSGKTIAGTIGAAGLGGSNALYTNQSNYGIGGQNGGTTTITLAGVTMSATGGAGAPAPNGNSFLGAIAGIGAGGDINAAGGMGSRIIASGNGAGDFNGSGGGGASGSPFGTGGRGGLATFGSGSGQVALNGAGGGWGGPGADGSMYSSITTAYSLGGGSIGGGGVATFGNEDALSALGGLGRSPVYPAKSTRSSSSPPILSTSYVPTEALWWDLEDVSGWGGSYVSQAQTSRTGLPLLLTDGGSGAGGAGGLGSRYGSCGGFGGGGAGSTGSSGPNNYNTGFFISPSPGGIGGGGGGFLCSLVLGPSDSLVRAGDGGSGCVVVWF